MAHQIAVAIRIEDPEAPLEPVTLTLSEPSPAPVAPPPDDRTWNAWKRHEARFEASYREHPLGSLPRPTLLARLSRVQRQYNALTAKPATSDATDGRGPTLREKLDAQDRASARVKAPYLTVCCGLTIDIREPCPRCGPQNPETD